MKLNFQQLSIFLSISMNSFLMLAQLSKDQNFSKQYQHKSISKSFKPFDYAMQENKHLRHLQSNSSLQYDPEVHMLKIKGNMMQGYYYVDIFVGNPPQEQSVVIDTGSEITVFPCEPCLDCEPSPPGHQKFNSNDSSTSYQIPCNTQIHQFQCSNCSADSKKCQFNIDYYQGTHLEGNYYQDLLSVGDFLQDFNTDNNEYSDDQMQAAQNISIPLTFGCVTKKSGIFLRQVADGIMGLGATTGTQGPPSIIDYYVKYLPTQGISSSFSICIGTDGGIMTIGGRNTKLYANLASTIILNYQTQKGQYGINVFGMKLNGTELGLSQSDFVTAIGTTPFLDSGTTFTYVSPRIYQIFLNAFDFHCNQTNNCQGQRLNNNSHCWYFDITSNRSLNSYLNTFPTIEFILDDEQNFEWFPSSYLFGNNIFGNVFCLNLFPLDDNIMIFGASFMHNNDIQFDKTNKQIKITRCDCSQNYTIDPAKQKQFYQEGESSIISIQADLVSFEPQVQFTKTLKFKIIIICVSFIFILLLILAIYLCVKIQSRRKEGRRQQIFHSAAQIGVPIRICVGLQDTLQQQNHPKQLVVGEQTQIMQKPIKMEPDE